MTQRRTWTYLTHAAFLRTMAFDETVAMLSHKKPDSVINVKVEFGESEGKVPLDNIAKRVEAYKPKERVTYKMIKEYIEARYGFKVHVAYIAEVKRELGLPMYDAPNAVEELKQPRKHPTAEKVEAIKDALKCFKPARTYKEHEDKYLKFARYVKNKYKDNKYFSFCQQEYYDKYLNNPNSTNAKDCFKATKIKGILWAYKLFYVGCSRAKENLVIVVDENKIASYGKEFIKRMISIGFDVIGGEMYGEENRDSYGRVY